MINIDPQVASLISLFIQIPLVFAFMWFTLKLQSIFNASLEKRDADWRAFMKQQQESWQAALTMLSGDVRDLVKSTEATAALLTQHDTWERNTR